MNINLTNKDINESTDAARAEKKERFGRLRGEGEVREGSQLVLASFKVLKLELLQIKRVISNIK